MKNFIVATRMPDGQIAQFESAGPTVGDARNEVMHFMATQPGFNAEKFSCVVSIPNVGRNLKVRLNAHRVKDPLQHALDVVCEVDSEGGHLD